MITIRARSWCPGGDIRLGALWLSVLLLFFCLPLRTDNSLLVAVAFVCAVWAARGRVSPASLFAGASGWALAGFLFYFAVAVVSSLLGGLPADSFLRPMLWAGCIVAGLLLSRLRPDHEYAFFLALAAGVIVSLAIGCAAWEIAGIRGWDIWHADMRLKLLSRHPSRLALYCAAALFYCLSRCLAEESVRRACGHAALVLVLAALLFATNTRTLILTLPLGLVFFALCLPRRLRKHAFVGGLVCALLLAGAVWAVKDSATGRRLVSAVEQTRQDPTFLSRLPIWRAGWEAFRAAPLLGHGVLSYGRLHGEFVRENRSMLEREHPRYEKQVKHAHNIVLNRMVETGVCGTAGFLLFYGGAMFCALRGWRKDRWVFALLAYYLAIGMLDDPLFRKNDAFMLLIAGAALGLPRQEDPHI